MDNNKVNIKLEKHLWPDEQRKRKQKRLIILGVLVAMLLSFGSGFIFAKAANPTITSNTPTENLSSESMKRFNTVLSILKNRWYFSKDMENPTVELVDNAIIGMLEQNGDPYTDYMTPEEKQAFEEAINQNFVGIGVQYYQVDDYSIVKNVFRNSPAEKAGVMAGDIFWTVDNQSVVGMSSEDISALVRGEENTKVVIEFKRDNVIVKLDISRGQVNQTVFASLVNDEIGLLEIDSFGLNSGSEVKYNLDMFTEQKVNKIIIDVRDNGGGYLSALNQIASFFLTKGQVILQQEDVLGLINQTKASGNNYANFEKIVLLANEGSASASEVLVAALHDNLNIDVIGTKTFGKGTVQMTEDLSQGYALKYTAAQWLGPNGERIHKLGIEPTIEVKLHEVFYHAIPLQKEDEEPFNYKLDDVSDAIEYVQKALDFLGYNPDRTDGYYSLATENSLKTFQENRKIPVNPTITNETISQLSAAIQREWNINREKHDLQLSEAIEYLQ
ncbi:MAG: PDZ domain-containing protein [Erysipelothrix sp.]|nr:PDZ domain-containing protein [Erysipelothrix sp.]